MGCSASHRPACQAQDGAEAKASKVSTRVTPQVPVDVGLGDEPAPDAHRPRFSGSPKKNDAWRSLSNMTFGSRPGVVIGYQKASSATSSPPCHQRRSFIRPPSPELAAHSP